MEKKIIWIKKGTVSKKHVCKTEHAFALRLRVLMLITILQCICSNVPKNRLIIFPHPPPPNTPPLATAPYCFHSAAGQRSRLRSKHQFLITVLVEQKIKIPAWFCLEDEVVLLFDSHFTFESKLRCHRLFLTVESTRGIRTLVALLELMEELVAWRCRNGKFNEQFQILPLELKVKFIWMLS